MDDPLVQERLAVLDPTYKSFVEGPFVNQAAVDLADVAELTDDERQALVSGLIWYLVYFITAAELEEFLIHVGIAGEKAAAIIAAFLETIPEEVIDGHDDIVTSLNLSDGQDPNLFVGSSPSPTPQSTSLNSIHTMAEDMNAAKSKEETTYTSSQAAILRESQNRANGVDDKPQWGNIGE